MTAPIRFSVSDAAAGTRLDKWLADRHPAESRARLKNLIESGCVTVDGEVIRSGDRRVKAGQEIDLSIPDPVDARPLGQDIPLDILYEDDALIVIDKPPGLVVHPAPGNPDRTLVNALIAHCGDSLSGIGGERRPGIVHRLDKDTSGVMVAAKTDRAHRHLAALFAAHDIDRQYLAVVWGAPEPAAGTITAAIGRSPRNRKKMAVTESGGKFAVTHYETVERLGARASLVRCLLDTGRTHQIRVHLSHIGHPVMGDAAYGGARPLRIETGFADGSRTEMPTGPEINDRKVFYRQALHARVLGFRHPVSNRNMLFETKIPNDINKLVSFLREI